MRISCIEFSGHSSFFLFDAFKWFQLSAPAGIVLALSVPFLYDKYQDHVNAMLPVAHEATQTQLKRFEDVVLKKIPLYSKKEKKIQ